MNNLKQGPADLVPEKFNLQTINKQKLAAALLIANKALADQNCEKEKRAVELKALNKELAFQIIEKEKRTDELEPAVKEPESFSYSVSHNLRAPLRAINGFTQVLVEYYLTQLDEEAKEILNEIIANSKKMGLLIDSLLEFSRLGKQFDHKEEINLNQLVSTVVKELKQLEPERNLDIQIQFLPNVKGDLFMLKQVFTNLIANALKYTSKKPEALIQIGATQENDFSTIYVKDNGAGFNMRYSDKLFGVFQRLHSSNEFEGNGVGLTIILKIILKHGGRIWGEEKVNEGACFCISLPH
jgi:light-regulated signal transduction histidine kinase (bacteriophytochrome)